MHWGEKLESEGNAMVETSREDPFMTAGQIRTQLASTSATNCSEAGLKNQNAVQIPLLPADAKGKRLAFAEAYVHWTTDGWRNIALTN